MFGDMIKMLLLRSMMASNSLSVSSPIIPSNVFRPGKTKKSIVLFMPKLLKNCPRIFWFISTSPAADLILNLTLVGMAVLANSGLTKFLLAPVSIRNFRMLPLLILYSMYGMLERLPS
jgi:hypothetical protein